jgi:hypothetical protein
MINIHSAIYALNPLIKSIHGDIAYDESWNEIPYDKTAAEAKLVELRQAEELALQAQEAAKASAQAKLAALGLTADEVSALTGVTA